MEKRENIIRLIICYILCLFVIAFDSYGIFSGSFKEDKKIKKQNLKTENVEKTEIIKETEENAENDASVMTGAKEVKGKIINRFITPYTANTSYNNVYLKNNTDLNIVLKEFLNSELSFKIEKNDKPQVLILHTHATESFMLEERDYYTASDKARTTNNSYNTVALGKIISDKLNSAGIKTVHATTQHDYPSYNDAYKNAAKTISEYKKKYPDIKIIIDLHRDSIGANDNDKTKVTTEIDGKKAAQVMLVMGSQSGDVKNFPDWRENLKLAVKLQQTIEVMYPTLARSISLMSRNYNESLSKGSLLLEIGTEVNNFEEVKYSADLVGNALISLLNTQQ